MKKLSHLQKTILSMAKQQGHVSNSDILTAVYGFEQTVYTRGTRFDRQQIGMDRYLSASAAVARSLTRLRDRGLVIRVMPGGYHTLTKEGHAAVSFSPP
jgi:cytochrome c peroxidase